ncbi:1,2-dihydroxy-3-keto-5-methylthiopentene dioxygenase 1 isoform X2 [Canna indica]|uniref:Acireductone dioxygenase n=1 Tax=Canna indica TaxID=4628 RepID=A0AAQ3JL21_9LILI|nr:1,2-dihydroxy-3-keto-5-methylthiopentene dioxygenase 1 isoform X2 [Canna indica]
METGILQDGKEEVLQAWYINDGTTDEEEEDPAHHCEPQELVSMDKLAELGILSWRLDSDDHYESHEDMKKIREARGYSHTYTFDLHPERLPNFETKVKSFFVEHLHSNEETTYCMEGSGYYDVRDQNERWIRIQLKKGGMILLPAGIYHRFSLDTNNYIKAVLFFAGPPVDLSFKRPNDDLPARKEYLATLMKKERIGSQGVLEAR